MRCLEPRVARVIDIACNDDLAAREPQLLFARPIELNDPVDGGNLLKEQGVIRAPLLDGRGTCTRSPADLTLDFRHRLLDSARRGFSFFRLSLRKKFRCLPVGEPRLEAAVHGKHKHDHFDKGGNVFAEEASGTEPIRTQYLLLHSEFSYLWR